MIRLDKYLANASLGSRKEVKNAIRKKLVTVNGEICKDDDRKIDETKDEVIFDGILVEYARHVYIMLNKPDGYLSATMDHNHPTVLELIDAIVPNDIFPVGRLDLDTEGLLLVTNDGTFSHRLMSPKRHVPKTYLVELAQPITTQGIQALEAGIDLGEGELCSPAQVVVRSEQTIELTIYEGKYHQVKRMMHAIDNEVTYLQRIRIADLELDPSLELGEWRYLNDADFAALFGKETQDETVSSTM
ncbi:MAG: pseudouridine synthase [Erysipelotrichaceae bacterium]